MSCMLSVLVFVKVVMHDVNFLFVTGIV